MNKVELTLIEVNPLTKAHLEEHRVVIEVDEFTNTDLPEYFIENLAAFRQKAARALASSMTDYDSFDNDSAYLDRLDRIAGSLYLEDMTVPNVVTRYYDIEGIYDNDGGIWAEPETGCCLGEAEFRGLWSMSLNSSYNLADRIDGDYSPDEAVASLVRVMEAQQLTGACGPRRPKVYDAEVALKELIQLARSGSENSLRTAVIEKGGEFIRLLNEEVSDDIVELSTDAEEAPVASL